MTIQTIFISNKSQANIVCQKCGQTRTVDVDPVALRGKTVQVRCKNCGHGFSVIFDARTRYRKDTALEGHYFRKSSGRDEFGQVAIYDLSQGGLRFEPVAKTTFREGEELNIEFRLDDHQKTTIRTRIVVRSIGRRDIGAEFVAMDDHTRKILGFYLLP